MSPRSSRTDHPKAEPAAPVRPPARVGPRADGSALAARRAGPRSPEEAEERYVSARDAWTTAMRAAASGRSSDLAALAIAQEAYEAAIVERDRWRSNNRVAIPVEPDAGHSPIDAVVGQELAWRRVHEQEHEPAERSLFGRMARRLRGR